MKMKFFKGLIIIFIFFVILKITFNDDFLIVKIQIKQKENLIHVINNMSIFIYQDKISI
jgi:hypothetical protein